MITDFQDKIIPGNCVEILPQLPENAFDLIVTSPPYYSKRNYGTESIWDAKPGCEHEWIETDQRHDNLRFRGDNANTGNNKQKEIYKPSSAGTFCGKCFAWKGQLGLEPTVQLYIDHLVSIFDLAKPVLKETGALYVNLADSYGGSGMGTKSGSNAMSNQKLSAELVSNRTGFDNLKNMPKKSLLGIPALFEIAMINRGWILRNVIIWKKPNPMPESPKDRLTNDYEFIYFFVKSNKTQFWINEKTNQLVSKRPAHLHITEPENFWHGYDYFYQQILKPQKDVSIRRIFAQNNIDDRKKDGANEYALSAQSQDKHYKKMLDSICNGKMPMRNERSSWETNDTYYAQMVYEAFVSSGATKGMIDKAGAILAKRLESDAGTVWELATKGYHDKHYATYPVELLDRIIYSSSPSGICDKCALPRVKFYPSKASNGSLKAQVAQCDCRDNAFIYSIILDPFAGACTTALGAIKHNRHYTMIEISDDYVEQGKRRIENWKKVVTPKLFD